MTSTEEAIVELRKDPARGKDLEGVRVRVDYKPATWLPPFVLVNCATGGMMYRPGTTGIPSFNTREEARGFAESRGWEVDDAGV